MTNFVLVRVARGSHMLVTALARSLCMRARRWGAAGGPHGQQAVRSALAVVGHEGDLSSRPHGQVVVGGEPGRQQEGGQPQPGRVRGQQLPHRGHLSRRRLSRPAAAVRSWGISGMPGYIAEGVTRTPVDARHAGEVRMQELIMGRSVIAVTQTPALASCRTDCSH